MSDSPTHRDFQNPTGNDAAVYELEEIWSIDWFPQSDHDRIQELIFMLPAGAASLLDVGCGNGLFVNELNEASPDIRPHRLHAVDRSATALKHVEVENCRCDISNLPFRDNEFEIVTCLEVVEHLPLDIYTAALSELTRVAARWIMISVPFEQNLKESLCECPSCATRFNPNYHLRSFDMAKLRNLLQEKGFIATTTRFLGSREEYVGYHRIRRLLSSSSRTKDPFPAFTICPMCKYSEPDALAAAAVARKRRVREHARTSRRSSGLRQLAKWLWPKRQRHAWLGVLYEKI